MADPPSRHPLMPPCRSPIADQPPLPPQSVIHKMFSKRDKIGTKPFKDLFDYSSETQSNPGIESMYSSGFQNLTANGEDSQAFRVFVATWNVGGKPPQSSLNLDDFLQVCDQADMYILGFQEIVPLNAGNVLVVEDNEPAAKWLVLINRSLNRSLNLCALSQMDIKSVSARGFRLAGPTAGLLFFQKPSLKTVSKNFRTQSQRRLKSCNCTYELERKYNKEFCFRCQKSQSSEGELSSDEDDVPTEFVLAGLSTDHSKSQMKYGLVASKQMVGIFVTIWMRTELIQHVAHLRISSISRGIMGCLGNKGCISVSLSFHQTSFCFVCSHLASGEKEGDELRRNSDVNEILKNTQFPKICRIPYSPVPEKILDHDRVIWLGDLNYRIAFSYSETRKLLEQNQWDTVLAKDQLKIEREAGRVFKGWKEGKIYFAPTYKYSYNSDTYAGENIKSKKQRRTPAWCDRILWHGDGMRQLTYVRKEFWFSDHRPVCATFLVDVPIYEGATSKGVKWH